MSNFEQQLEALINACSMEHGSNTPDFILAAYLTRCLEAYNDALRAREQWYGRPFGDRVPMPTTPAPDPRG